MPPTNRTPSTAGSSDVPFSFPQPQENRDTSTELVTGVFPSIESPGAVTYSLDEALNLPVQEKNPKDKANSVREENPTEKVNTSFSCPIQEESPMEKPNTSLSSPVQDQLSDPAKEHDNKEITKLLENPQNAREFLLPRSTSIPQLGRGVSVEADVLDESSVVRATMKFEAEHEECLYVGPYLEDGEVVVNLYVYSGKSGIPAVLKTAAQEFFGEMGLKLKWNDLYNDAYNILNVAPIEYPSGEPKRLQASQIDEIDEIINKNLHVFSKHRNITALQPSLKVTKSAQTEEACITVYVLGKGSIPMGESVIPCAIDSYPVDVVNGFCVRTKEPNKPTTAQKQKEVLRLGASIGVDGEQSSGTLGAVVEDANTGTLYALSCDHVMKHADKSEIIHPGLDVYLNYLHYHLNEYKKWIDRITEPDFELPKIPVDIHQEPAELLNKFIELKAIKELHGTSTRSSKDIMKGIMKHEKKLEKGFSKQPRIIANYTTGIRHNVVSAKNSVKEHFIDAAISELKEDEEKNLRRSKTTEIIESGHYPSGECIPATTKATMNVEELFKSGSATGFTESSLLLGVSISPPMTIKAFRQRGESAWMDVKCIICKEREAAQSQVQELTSPCELCKPDKWLKSCLCIQKQGPRPFSDHGDSGAVIFEKRRKENGEDYETACPGFGIIFAVHKSSYFDFTIASPLEIALEALSQKVSNSRPDSRPCELRLTSRFNTN